MTDTLHKSLGTTDIHIPYSFSYADESARTGATGLVEADNYKFAFQEDTETLWFLMDYSGPDWAEVVMASGNAPGVSTAITLLRGNASGQAGLRLGASVTEGLELTVIDETVTGAASAAEDLTADVTGIILSVQANLEDTITGASGCLAVGIGVAADPDKYGESAALTQNTKVDTLVGGSPVSAEDIQVYATDGAGTATGTFTGDVRVRIVYWATNSLDDA